MWRTTRTRSGTRVLPGGGSARMQLPDLAQTERFRAHAHEVPRRWAARLVARLIELVIEWCTPHRAHDVFLESCLIGCGALQRAAHRAGFFPFLRCFQLRFAGGVFVDDSGRFRHRRFMRCLGTGSGA